MSGSASRRNTAYLVDEQERILGRYHKRVLMPWGERAYGQDWVPGLRRLLGDVADLAPGTSVAPLTVPGRGRLAVLICYEDLTSAPARATTLEGGQVLLNLNNLSLFGRTPAAALHQRLAAFRAVETRRWLVRCGTTAGTSVITATGQIEQQATPHMPATLAVSVPLLDEITPYTRHGDVFAITCLVVTAVWSLLCQALDVLYGDDNGDGQVNITDMLLLRGANTTSNRWADLNGDGVVNIIDMLLLRGRNGTSLSRPRGRPSGHRRATSFCENCSVQRQSATGSNGVT